MKVDNLYCEVRHMDKVKIWETFLEQIHFKVSDVTFNTWFKDLKLLTINENEYILI